MKRRRKAIVQLGVQVKVIKVVVPPHSEDWLSQQLQLPFYESIGLLFSAVGLMGRLVSNVFTVKDFSKWCLLKLNVDEQILLLTLHIDLLFFR